MKQTGQTQLTRRTTWEKSKLSLLNPIIGRLNYFLLVFQTLLYLSNLTKSSLSLYMRPVLKTWFWKIFNTHFFMLELPKLKKSFKCSWFYFGFNPKKYSQLVCAQSVEHSTSNIQKTRKLESRSSPQINIARQGPRLDFESWGAKI